MRPSVPRGNKKRAVQPVIITTENVCIEIKEKFLFQFIFEYLIAIQT